MGTAAVYSQRKQRAGVGADSKANKGERNTKKKGTRKSQPVVGETDGQILRETREEEEEGWEPKTGPDPGLPGSQAQRRRDVGGGAKNPGSQQAQQRQTDRASVKAQGATEAKQEGRTGPAPCGISLCSQGGKPRPHGEPGLTRSPPT